jgi:hypothetical protein
VIEALFKKYKIFVICSFNILFCIEEKDLAIDNYVSNYQPICSQGCIDIYLKEKKPYIGLHWMVSHNLLISNKISLYNEKDNDEYYHSLSGLDLKIFDKNNYDLYISFDLNKISYYESQSYRWHQMSLIYLAKFKKSNFQIVIDSIYDNDWDYKAINYIYGINIYDNVFLNMGLIQNLSNNDFDGLLTLNFSI